MKALNLFMTLVIALSSLYGCKKDSPAASERCEKLVQALGEEDKDALREQIDAIIAGLKLQSPAAFTGQQEDMNRFVAKLNECSDLEATLICLWCIDTLPPQTEIKVTFSWNGVQITRIIDLIQVTGSGFRFASVHE